MLKKIISITFDTCKGITLGVVDVSTTAVKGLFNVGKDTVITLTNQVKNTEKKVEEK